MHKVLASSILVAAFAVGLAGSSQATEVKLTYQFSGNITDIPSGDKIPNIIPVSDSGSTIEDVPDLTSFFLSITTGPGTGFGLSNEDGKVTASINYSKAVRFGADINSTPADIFGTYSIKFGSYADLVDVYIPGADGADTVTVDITGSYSLALVAGVPLPSSAPLFGGAVLALGMAGYGLKRKRTGTAA